MMDPLFKQIFGNVDEKTKIRRVQEWLCLSGFSIVIDGIFGPATKQALINFQKVQHLPSTGELTDDTLACLVSPMKSAMQILPADTSSLGKMMVEYAKLHLSCRPREVGGQNMGPWVRMYMGGKEGVDWPWCAGFVSFLLKQACESLGRPIPFQTSPSCYLMAQSAMKKPGMYIYGKGKATGDLGDKLNGAIFFVRSPGKWSHTGIVLQALSESFYTIEGNTNDEGSAEGHEVCQRIRGYENKDFILLS
jgi:hypothetical protein